jgi:hypothetical protein
MPAAAAAAAPAAEPRPKPRARKRSTPARRPKMTVYRSSSSRIPLAAGRAAVAVRELPDSGAVVRLTRGRLWIGVLGTLLVGIVALNVVSLGLNSSSGRAGEQANELEQANSALRAQIAEKLSSSKVEAAAMSLGLAVPAPGDISYLTYSGSDLARAAKGLAHRAVAAVGETGTVAIGAPASSSAAATPAATSAPAAPSAPAPTAPPPSGTGAGAGGGVSAGI